MSEWISVKDRIPETETYVIVFINHENHYVNEPNIWIASLVDYGEYMAWGDGYERTFPFEDISHWMPLPSYPNGDCYE